MNTPSLSYVKSGKTVYGKILIFKEKKKGLYVSSWMKNISYLIDSFM